MVSNAAHTTIKIGKLICLSYWHVVAYLLHVILRVLRSPRIAKSVGKKIKKKQKQFWWQNDQKHITMKSFGLKFIRTITWVQNFRQHTSVKTSTTKNSWVRLKSLLLFAELDQIDCSQFWKLTSCNCSPLYSSLLTKSASYLDWWWLITGLDLLFMALRKILLTTLSSQMTKNPLCQVRCRICVTFDILPFQFTICSSATSDALLTGVHFFR